jgi:hypothetical protein
MDGAAAAAHGGLASRRGTGELQSLRAQYPAISRRFAIRAALQCPNGATSRFVRAISAKFPGNFARISSETPDPPPPHA